MNEKQLDAAVRELTAMFGWLRYHTFDSRRSPGGFPDLVLVRPPRVIAAELKAENGRLTAKQAEWLNALGQCPGIETYVWRPQDFDHVTAMLSGDGGRREPFPERPDPDGPDGKIFSPLSSERGEGSNDSR